MRRGAILCLTAGVLFAAAVVPSVSAGAAGGVVPNSLWDVTCPSSTRCFAVGNSFTKPGANARTLVERWNGSSWSIMPSPNSSVANTWLTAVACTSTTSCMAVGNASASGYGGSAFALRMTGTTWSTVAIPAGGPRAGLRGIACTAPTNCFAVGAHGGSQQEKPLALRWNGKQWKTVPAALPTGLSAAYLLGVDCGSGKCFAVGGSDDMEGPNVAIIERWNGTKWVIDRQFKTTGGISPQFRDVTCPTKTRCRAVGDDGSAFVRTLAASWTGTTWSVEAPKNRDEENYLTGIACWQASDCMAVGRSTESNAGPMHTLGERRSGSTWSIVGTPNKNPDSAELDSVACIGPKRCFAVGTSNAASPVVILQWDGTTWTSVKTP
jgi:hypothetical protein